MKQMMSLKVSIIVIRLVLGFCQDHFGCIPIKARMQPNPIWFMIRTQQGSDYSPGCRKPNVIWGKFLGCLDAIRALSCTSLGVQTSTFFIKQLVQLFWNIRISDTLHPVRAMLHTDRRIRSDSCSNTHPLIPSQDSTTSTSPSTVTWRQLPRPWPAQSLVWRCGTGCGSRLRLLMLSLVCFYRLRTWAGLLIIMRSNFFSFLLSWVGRKLCLCYGAGWILCFSQT